MNKSSETSSFKSNLFGSLGNLFKSGLVLFTTVGVSYFLKSFIAAAASTQDDATENETQKIPNLSDILSENQIVTRSASKRVVPEIELFDEQNYNLLPRFTIDYFPRACFTANGNGAVAFLGVSKDSLGNDYWGPLYYLFKLTNNQLNFYGKSEFSFEGQNNFDNNTGFDMVVTCGDNSIDFVWVCPTKAAHARLVDNVMTIPPYVFHQGAVSLGIADKLTDITHVNGTSYFITQNSTGVLLFKTNSSGMFNSVPEIVSAPSEIPFLASPSISTYPNGEYVAIYNKEGDPDFHVQNYFANGTKNGIILAAKGAVNYRKSYVPKNPLVNPFPFLSMYGSSSRLDIQIFDRNGTILESIIMPQADLSGPNQNGDITSCGPQNPNWFPFVRNHISNPPYDYDIALNFVDNKGKFLLPQDLIINQITQGTQYYPSVVCDGYRVLVSFQSRDSWNSYVRNIKYRIANIAKLLNATVTAEQSPLSVETTIPTLQTNQSIVLSTDNVQLQNVDELTIQSATNLTVTFYGTNQTVNLPYTDTPENILNNKTIVVTGLDGNSTQKLEFFGCNTTTTLCTPGTTKKPNSTLAQVFDLREEEAIPNWLWYVIGAVGATVAGAIGIGAYIYNRKDNKAERKINKEAAKNNNRINQQYGNNNESNGTPKPDNYKMPTSPRPYTRPGNPLKDAENGAIHAATNNNGQSAIHTANSTNGQFNGYIIPRHPNANQATPAVNQENGHVNAYTTNGVNSLR